MSNEKMDTSPPSYDSHFTLETSMHRQLKDKRIILASGSPRRKQLFEQMVRKIKNGDNFLNHVIYPSNCFLKKVSIAVVIIFSMKHCP